MVADTTLKQRVEAVLDTPGVLAKLAGDVRNEQALADVRDTFLGAVEGHEKVFIDYLEAHQKTMELRLKAGMQHPGAKLTHEQKQKIAQAAKAEQHALKTLVDAIPEGDKEITAKLLPELAETYNGAKAAAAHKEMLAKIKETVIKEPHGLNPFAKKTISRLVQDYSVALSKGDAEGSKKIMAKLKEAIEHNKHTKELPAKDKEELFAILTQNHAEAVAINKTANPITEGIKNTAAQAVGEVQKLPAQMVTSAITGLPPGAVAGANLAAGLARNFTNGGKT